MSYLEIYIEEVRDLLGKNPLARLEVRERMDIGVYVKDLSSFVVKNADEMDKLTTIGNKNSELKSSPRVLLLSSLQGWVLLLSSLRLSPGVFAVTDMNDHSSRSHVIFTITVEQSEIGPDKQQHVRMGKLHLVDLAVSWT